MIVGYLQQGGSTMVVLGEPKESMIGFARIRPGDKWNPGLGIAVAMLKAEPGGVRDSQEKQAIETLLSRTKTSLGSLKRFEITDEGILVWARLWHEYRVALKHVAERREALAREFIPPLFGGHDKMDAIAYMERAGLRPRSAMRQEGGHLLGATNFTAGFKAVSQFKKLPSDGQLAEHFGLRLIKQSGEPLFA